MEKPTFLGVLHNNCSDRVSCLTLDGDVAHSWQSPVSYYLPQDKKHRHFLPRHRKTPIRNFGTDPNLFVDSNPLLTDSPSGVLVFLLVLLPGL